MPVAVDSFCIFYFSKSVSVISVWLVILSRLRNKTAGNNTKCHIAFDIFVFYEHSGIYYIPTQFKRTFPMIIDMLVITIVIFGQHLITDNFRVDNWIDTVNCFYPVN